MLDARERTKTFLDTYLTNANLTDNNGDEVVFAVLWEGFDYPIASEFLADENPVDLLFVVGYSRAKPVVTHVRYEENVPIWIYCINKTTISGTLLKWLAEHELRRIFDVYPFGSFRRLELIEDNDIPFGATILYSVKLMLKYRRTADYS